MLISYSRPHAHVSWLTLGLMANALGLMANAVGLMLMLMADSRPHG